MITVNKKHKKRFLLKTAFFFARHLILSLLLIFVLSSFSAAGLVLFYYIIGEKKASGVTPSLFSVREDTRKEVTAFWQEQENILQQSDSKEYPDVFSSASVVRESNE